MTDEQPQEAAVQPEVGPDDGPVVLKDLTDITGKIMLCVEYSKEEHEELKGELHPCDKKGYVMGKPVKVRR